MEACPNKLAPTSSTTVQMAIGDALAVCLMELNNFKDQDFAKFHPGGSLGKNLTARVEQFVSEQRPLVEVNSSIKDVIFSISSSKHGITVVTDQEMIAGVITDAKLRRMLLNTEHLTAIRAKDLMPAHPKTVARNALANAAMTAMNQHTIGQLIIP